MTLGRRAVLSLAALTTWTVLALVPEAAVALPTPGTTTEPTAAVRAGPPHVIGHRGAPGYRPEHTLEGYELAVRMGADAIEPDLVMTKDGVLVARHETELSATTDVALHPEFAARRTTRNGTTGWFVEDFTLAEVKTLRARERWPTVRPGSASYDGRFLIPTFDEILSLRASASTRTGRTVVVVPEIKGWAALHAAGLDPETALVAGLERAGLNRRSAPVWTQSAQWTPLVNLRNRHGYRPGLVFVAFASGGPSDLAAAGTPRTYREMISPAGLVELAAVVDAVAAEKGLVIPRRSDGRLGTPTSLVADAGRVGLRVFAFTFRAENSSLPTDLRVGTSSSGLGRLDLEVRAFFRAGTTAVFCDHPDLCRRGFVKPSTRVRRP